MDMARFLIPVLVGFVLVQIAMELQHRRSMKMKYGKDYYRRMR
jgi:hypothetical protein